MEGTIKSNLEVGGRRGGISSFVFFSALSGVEVVVDYFYFRVPLGRLPPKISLSHHRFFSISFYNFLGLFLVCLLFFVAQNKCNSVWYM